MILPGTRILLLYILAEHQINQRDFKETTKKIKKNKKKQRLILQKLNSLLSEEEEECISSNPRPMTPKSETPAPTTTMMRQAALVLNASRRFRYTLDLKKEEEEKQQQLRNVRAHAQAIRAAYPEKEAGQKSNGTDNLKKEEEKQKVAFLVQETGRYIKEGVTDLGELACHRGLGGFGAQISGRASDKSK
ncbi:hypothetical protein ACOSQ2_015922 [Xanthoceras sorbifolium]